MPSNKYARPSELATVAGMAVYIMHAAHTSGLVINDAFLIIKNK